MQIQVVFLMQYIHNLTPIAVAIDIQFFSMKK